MKKKILKAIYSFAKRLNENTHFVLNELRQILFYMDFEERKDDVYLVAYPKSGTTWMQVILHNLLTDGNMNFDHIYQVSPWVSNEAFLNKGPERINRLPSPRILKSHNKYDFFHKDIKGRFICIYRDGKDVAVSYYHQNKNYRYPDLTFDKNFDIHFVKGAGKHKNTWFSYNEDWFKNENEFEILYVSYEELKANFRETLQKLANFLKVNLTTEIIERTEYHSSFNFMKENEDKFGEPTPKIARLVFDNFIRSGQSGEGSETLNEHQQRIFQAKYNKHIVPYLSKIKES